MEILLNNQFINDDKLSTFDNCINVYDALRIQDGIALFTEDHFKRLQKSINIAGFKYTVTHNEWENKLYKVIKRSNIINGNIRTDLFINKKGEIDELIKIYTAKYPTANDYKYGVKCILQFDERTNPNAKISNPAVRSLAEKIIAQENVYETILVDQNNNITEGSRTNIFAIKNNQLLTAPDHMILPGIMRSKVIKCASDDNIPILYSPINIDNIKQMDAMFISGTSPRVISISKINNIELPVNHDLISRIQKSIENLVQEYILINKSKKRF